MKPICHVLVVAAVFCTGMLRAQDAATQERLDKLSGQIEDLIANQRAQQKQMEALAREVEALREQAGKHTGNYASQEEVKALREAIKEVDRKRMDDAERISEKIEKLGKLLANSKPVRTPSAPADTPEKTTPEKGFSYVVQSGDTLSVIVQAYRDKNIKISTEQILKANPGLKPEKLKVGQKLWIPAPQS